MSAATSFQLLRHVEADSILHRADARTKVAALTVAAVTLSLDPSWSTVIAVWGAVLVGFLATGLPRSVVPRPPRALWWGIALSLILGLLAGGEPNLTPGRFTVGVGGLIFQFRFLAVSFAFLALALLLGWTTPLGRLPGAAAWMLAPLRRLGVPTDDVVVGLALAVRSLPLLAEELTTTAALWSARPRSPGGPTDRAGRVTRPTGARLGDVVDLVATATTAATRRARELGQALTARGLQAPPGDPFRPTGADVVVTAVTVAIVAIATAA